MYSMERSKSATLLQPPACSGFLESLTGLGNSLREKTMRNSVRFSNPLVSLTSPRLSRLTQPFLPFLLLDLLYFRHSQHYPF